MGVVNLDGYLRLESPVHRWTPHLKLAALSALMFAFATVQTLALAPLMLGSTLLLYGASRLPLRFLLQRLRYPGLFIAAVVLALPFASGHTVLWQWGLLSLKQEGLEAMGLVVCRFLSILTLGFILLGTTPFLSLVKAMRSLGLPPLLADMTLLSYRYLYDMADTLATMQQAMRLRGFGRIQRWGRLNSQVLKQMAALIGTLLIRSYERSERVYKAMRLRGYGQAKPASTPSLAADPMSLALTLLAGTAAIAVVIAEVAW